MLVRNFPPGQAPKRSSCFMKPLGSSNLAPARKGLENRGRLPEMKARSPSV